MDAIEVTTVEPAASASDVATGVLRFEVMDLDHDADGIGNFEDIDDDNDGIVDAIERQQQNLSFNLSGDLDGDRDRGAPNDLNRDFIFGDDYTFSLNFDFAVNAQILTTIGDTVGARNGTVTVNGVTENISTPAGNFQTVTHTGSGSSFDINWR